MQRVREYEGAYAKPREFVLRVAEYEYGKFP